MAQVQQMMQQNPQLLQNMGMGGGMGGMGGGMGGMGGGMGGMGGGMGGMGGGMGGMGGGMGGGLGGFQGGMGGFGNPTPTEPVDPNQTPEERFKDQLEKLNDMGFTNKDVNIQILQQCNGNVDIAVERLLNLMG
jgi:hypothetical protein